MSERITTLIRTLKKDQSITVDGPAQFTLGHTRTGRAIVIIKVPESTIISTRKHVPIDQIVADSARIQTAPVLSVDPIGSQLVESH